MKNAPEKTLIQLWIKGQTEQVKTWVQRVKLSDTWKLRNSLSKPKAIITSSFFNQPKKNFTDDNTMINLDFEYLYILIKGILAQLTN